MQYGSSITTSLDFVTAVETTRAALAEQGLGVLTEIVQATMKKKLDKDVEPQVILGACNPDLASRRSRPTPASDCSCRAPWSSGARATAPSSRRWTRR